MAKGIVYIDVDDEITAVIEKVEQSKDKVVALVLPKHATTFLSTVNMKLLKKAAASVKKSIVLITSDPNILPLAGAARLHVAKSLQSKPTIPEQPKIASDQPIDLDAEPSTPSIPAGDALKAATAAATAAPLAAEESGGVIELDNTTKKAPKLAPMAPKNRKLKVPDFTSFRLRLFLGGFLLIALVVFLFLATTVLPKAKIILKTDTTDVDVALQFTASTSAKDLDTEKNLVPATQTEHDELDTEKAIATGKKDIGTKATGTMSVYNCSKTDDTITLPAGTVFSNSGHSFTTNDVVSVPASNFKGNGDCKTDVRRDVAVTAVQAGDASNLSADRSYTSAFADTVGGIGSAMGGGTSNIVTVLSNDDIDAAKQKLTGRQKSEGTSTVKQQLTDAHLEPLADTLKEGAPVFTADAAVGDQVANATVKADTKYTMLGVKKEDLTKLLETYITKKTTNTQQKIQQNGYGQKQLQLIDGNNTAEQKLSLATKAVVGPDIDLAGIAQESAGKKKGEIQRNLLNRAGIKDVTVNYSPFWVTKTPNKPSKITIVVEKSNATN